MLNSTAQRKRQFTIRGLLLVTTVVGFSLAICVQFPGLGFVLVAVALLLSEIAATAILLHLVRSSEVGVTRNVAGASLGILLVVWIVIVAAVIVSVAANPPY